MSQREDILREMREVSPSPRWHELLTQLNGHDARILGSLWAELYDHRHKQEIAASLNTQAEQGVKPLPHLNKDESREVLWRFIDEGYFLLTDNRSIALTDRGAKYFQSNRDLFREYQKPHHQFDNRVLQF
jgi:hypothetical protein